jgi:putative membrane protein
MTTKKNKHGTVRRAVDKVQDTIGGVAGRAKAATVVGADAFVEQAAVGDHYEIEAARLALRRARSPEVKAVAEQMLQDHTTSKHHLAAALEMNEARSVKHPPRELDARRQKLLEHLAAAPDDHFDATYLDQQVLAHEETSALFSTYGKRGDNPQLRSFALGTAPVIERHLSRMKALKARLAH